MMSDIKIGGKAWKYGDDVNTDLIVPGKYLELVDPEEMALHAMEGLDPEFPEKITKGDVVVGGVNFGCGSSREHAPLALKYAGVGAVIAESFARIFYRNAINVGLPALECPGIIKAVEEGDKLEVDITEGKVKNLSKKVELNFVPLPEFMIEVLGEGGLVTYIKNHLEEW
jgi:3-isopropylmalate/(R)-2-methylmalate dehydratase small subunit